MKAALLGPTAALALAACAPYPPQPAPAPGPQAAAARQCFHAGQVNGYREVDRKHVDLTVGAREVWRVQLFGACPDINWSSQIGVRGRGGGSFICSGHDVEFIVPSMGQRRPTRCAARSIRLLTPAEAAAPRPG